jgi:hypothetical protein
MDDDALSLHLAFFLASWGMYRGSSFLLQKDYTIHRPVVRLLRSPELRILRGATTPILKRHFEKILYLQNEISNAYVAELEHSNWVNGKRRKVAPSDILDDRFHETGLDEASIYGTGIRLVDSSFEKS